MKRWLCLSAATAALVLVGCNEDDKKPAPQGAATPAPVARGAAPQAYAAAPSHLPGGPRVEDGLTAILAASNDGDGRRLFDGQTLSRAGFTVPGDSSPVYVPPGAARRSPPLTPLSGRPQRVTDLGRTVPGPGAVNDAAQTGLLARAAGSVLAQFVTFQQACYTDFFPGIGRSHWGAAPLRGAPVPMRPTHVTVHHTEGPQTMSEDATARAVKNIQSYHMANTDGRHGWDDIGYHFLIDGAGRVVEGRPTETLGAHAGGANQDNIGISVMGDFNHQQPTAAQVESLTRLVSFLAVKYGQDPARNGFLEPHRHYDQTDCPGKNMMSILASLRERINAQTSDLVSRLARAPAGQFVPAVTTDA